MNLEELKEVVKGVVQEEVAPLKETQKKYDNVFIVGGNSEPEEKGEKLEPGLRMARFAKCLVLGKNDPERALSFAKGLEGQSSKGMYPQDTMLHAAFKALSATNPSEGGFTVPVEMANEIVPLLYAKTVVRELGARTLPMSSGNMNLPKITGGASSYYQGENRAATKSQQTFGNIHLASKKLFTLVPTSNDLIRNSSLEADRYVRDDMVTQTRLKMDYTALYGAGTQFTPIGVKNVVGISKASITSIPDADVPGTLLALLMTKNLPMLNVGWAFNGTVWGILYNLKTTTGAYIYRDEMNIGKLLGFPFKISNQIPTGTDNHGLSDLFLGDWSEFLIGEEIAIEMSASMEASYDDGTGTMVSTFTNDQTLIKLLAKHDFATRHPEAFICNTYYTK